MKKKNIFYLLGLSVAASFASEKMLRRKDKPLTAYGQKVRVYGKYISTEIIGNGNHAIVLYPGACEVSPILAYKPLAKKLASYFTVITFEPFGYGASDKTDHARTIENMSEELHQTMKMLGYKKYSIGMHSAGGIIGMALAIKYPEEVESCLLLDTTPVEITNYTSSTFIEKISGYLLKGMNELGISRLLHKANHLMPNKNYAYSNEEKEQYFKCTLQNGFSKNMEEELDELDANLRSMEGKKYPSSIPVYAFVSTTTDKVLTKFGAPSGTWIDSHKHLSDNPSSKLMVLDGSHYLHQEKEDLIAKEYINFFKETIH